MAFIAETVTSLSDPIEEFARLRTDGAMERVVTAAQTEAFGIEETFRLANALAHSGAIIEFTDDDRTADLASTGAPGSLSTLLGPLYLRAAGLKVPKLGVPGRPAGGVDVLAQLRGYRIALSTIEVLDIVARCGYAHWLAGAEFAPLDANLFRYRQKVGAQNVPVLAAASLLAKKIASGVRFAGLDVRVAAHGNFGGNFADARKAATIFCAAAGVAKITAVAMLTDARTLYQPYLGRGESLLALKLVFEERADPWLAEHNDRCRLMAAHVAALRRGVDHPMDIESVEQAFAQNLTAQGSTMEAFAEKTDSIARAPRRPLTAGRDGFLTLDIEAVRSAFVRAQGNVQGDDRFPDVLGIIVHAKPGTYVRRGDTLASVRADEATWASAGEDISEAFQVLNVLDYASGLEDIVRA